MDVFAKAQELGIDPEFVGSQGELCRIAPEALNALVAAMPQVRNGRFLAGPAVLRGGDVSTIRLTADAALPVRWQIVRDRGIAAEGEVHGRDIGAPADLSIGTYSLRLSDAAGAEEVWPLIVAPHKAYQGDFDRSWLLAVQLYGIRSLRNWGMGDFTDLRQLIDIAARWGADGIGLNPLHALFPERPNDCSPYAPNSRLFLNALYIDAEAIPELSASFTIEHEGALQRLRQSMLVDYVGVAELKWAALRSAFDQFKANPHPARASAFAAFCEAAGSALWRFACFEVLRCRFQRPWWEWPMPWQVPEDAACESLRTGSDAKEIEFVAFVQWIADEQLAACRDRAAQLGLNVGLYLDIAVGVQPDGFDAWNEQAAISRHLSVGAPPDVLNTIGQNWGLAGFNAAGLTATGFAPYRDMLRAAMRYAGAVRLDHVLGLNRLYLIPQGFSARDGAYMQMPFQALLAITAQESVAARCVVIGEDLGTVPEGFRDAIAAWGIWSYRVMMFERDYRGGFCGIEHYAPNALVTFNTHDLASFSGWREGSDLTLKRSLGMEPGESTEAREHALRMLRDVLRGESIEQDDFYGVLRFLSKTPSRLLAVALDDLLAVVDQPNVPGTIDQHPNWRRRLPSTLDEITETFDEERLEYAIGQDRSRSRKPKSE